MKLIMASALLVNSAFAAGPAIAAQVTPSCVNGGNTKVVGESVAVTVSAAAFAAYSSTPGLRYHFREINTNLATDVNHSSGQRRMGFALKAGNYQLLVKTKPQNNFTLVSSAQYSFTIPLCAVDPKNPHGGKGSTKGSVIEKN